MVGSFLYICDRSIRFAYSVSFVADGAALLGREGHARYPDDEDNQVRSHLVPLPIYRPIISPLLLLYCIIVIAYHLSLLIVYYCPLHDYITAYFYPLLLTAGWLALCRVILLGWTKLAGEISQTMIAFL